VAPPPASQLKVQWEARHDKNSSEVIQSGEVIFPAYFEDELIVELTSMVLPVDVDEKFYYFQVKDATETFDGDASRPKYTFFSDDGREVNVQLLKYSPMVVSDGTSDSGLDTWLILVIAGAALVAIAVIGFFAFRYYKLYIAESEEKAQAIEELNIAEQGIGGFFENANVHNVQENPLHGDTYQDGTMALDVDNQAQMVVVDDADDQFELRPKEIEQRMLGADPEKQKSLSPHSRGDPASDERYRESSAASLSAHGIEPGTLPF